MEYGMDVKEMSDLFDVLYNNITSNQAPALNEYEKSVFLTKAQDELLKNYFLPQSNSKQSGFDGNQKRQIDFSMLMTTATIKHAMSESITPPEGNVDSRAYVFNLPSNILYIINESLQYVRETLAGTDSFSYAVKAIRQVVALSFEEYTRLMSKPFKEPVKYQAWRLMTSTYDNTGSGPSLSTDEEFISTGRGPQVDIVMTSADKKKYSGDSNDKVYYVIRYVRRPKPIILSTFSESLGEDLKIHGEDIETACELDPILHEEIVQRAVELAKVAWQGDVQAVTQAGQRSE